MPANNRPDILPFIVGGVKPFDVLLKYFSICPCLYLIPTLKPNSASVLAVTEASIDGLITGPPFTFMKNNVFGIGIPANVTFDDKKSTGSNFPLTPTPIVALIFGDMDKSK